LNWSEEEYQEYLKKNGIKTAKDKPKKSKYNSKHVWEDGICFDSRKEAGKYQELKLRLMAGDIKGFCLQPTFPLVEGNAENRAVTYSPDFIVLNNDGTYEIIDTKGYEPQQWERTYKMFRLKYPRLDLKIEK
jgi:hypothetical protein